MLGDGGNGKGVHTGVPSEEHLRKIYGVEAFDAAAGLTFQIRD